MDAPIALPSSAHRAGCQATVGALGELPTPIVLPAQVTAPGHVLDPKSCHVSSKTDFKHWKSRGAANSLVGYLHARFSTTEPPGPDRRTVIGLSAMTPPTHGISDGKSQVAGWVKESPFCKTSRAYPGAGMTELTGVT
jgi:hypothetical protein